MSKDCHPFLSNPNSAGVSLAGTLLRVNQTQYVIMLYENVYPGQWTLPLFKNWEKCHKSPLLF